MLYPPYNEMHDDAAEVNRTTEGYESEAELWPCLPTQYSCFFCFFCVPRFPPRAGTRTCHWAHPVHKRISVTKGQGLPSLPAHVLGALGPFLMKDTKQLPVQTAMTHHQLPVPRRADSAESSMALHDVTGSFDLAVPHLATHLGSIYRTLFH